jgi:hypothetical protein
MVLVQLALEGAQARLEGLHEAHFSEVTL